jgi:hypothetical protein
LLPSNLYGRNHGLTYWQFLFEYCLPFLSYSVDYVCFVVCSIVFYLLIIYESPCDGNGLTILTIQHAWLNLDGIISKWLFQDKVFSFIILRKFKVEVFNIILLL